MRARQPMSALGGMRRNVEVKARLRAREEALGTALRLQGLPQVCPEAGQGPGEGQGLPRVCPGAGQVLLQTDTFFRVPRGRLKLRRTQVRSGWRGWAWTWPRAHLCSPVPVLTCPRAHLSLLSPVPRTAGGS